MNLAKTLRLRRPSQIAGTALCLLLSLTAANAESIRLRARLDESQVVRPPAFQPPVFGTGSPGVGICDLVIDTETAEFSFDLRVSGITASLLDNSVGPNSTALHIHRGLADERGPVIIDAHHYAREASALPNGIVATEDGFRVRVSGMITQQQGDLDTGLSPREVIQFLQSEEAFIAVHSTENDLTRTGAIRGKLERIPSTISLRAILDEAQVVRPPAFQPPMFGTGSPGRGVCDLTIDTITAEFSLKLDVEGIAPASIDNSIGPNNTGLHIHRGSRDARGPVIIDIHYFGRLSLPDQNGLRPTENGFAIEVDGTITPNQGKFNAELTVGEIIGVLLDDQAFVAIHTTDNDLTRTGAIRGHFGPATRFIRGDCDGDGTPALTDGVMLLHWLFLSGDRPNCLAACDADATGRLDVTSAVYLFLHLFSGGPAPEAPYPRAGSATQPSDLLLGCNAGM